MWQNFILSAIPDTGRINLSPAPLPQILTQTNVSDTNMKELQHKPPEELKAAEVWRTESWWPLSFWLVPGSSSLNEERVITRLSVVLKRSNHRLVSPERFQEQRCEGRRVSVMNCQQGAAEGPSVNIKEAVCSHQDGRCLRERRSKQMQPIMF